MKKIWKENRVLLALFTILIVCFVAIFVVTIYYFVGSHTSVYGDRLNNKVEIKDDVKKEYIEKLESDELIVSAEFRVAIRTIYVDIKFTEKAALTEAESKALASLDMLSEEILGYYDVNFILSKDETETDAGFTIMGAKNISGNGISWNNNTKEKEE